jgi:hypothetical protein
MSTLRPIVTAGGNEKTSRRSYNTSRDYYLDDQHTEKDISLEKVQAFIEMGNKLRTSHAAFGASVSESNFKFHITKEMQNLRRNSKFFWTQKNRMKAD